MSRIVINGRFLTQPVTGVQRVAAELVKASDGVLQSAVDGRPWELWAPPSAKLDSYGSLTARTLGPGGLPPHLWEQVVLPLATRDAHLLSFAGSSPWAQGQQTCLLHDAAVFDHPEAYRFLFRTWYRRLFVHLARSGADLLTVSRFSQGRLSTHLGCPPETFTVVYPGADHVHAVPRLTPPEERALLARMGLDQQADFFLAVGTQNPTKNQALLVRAWRQLPQPRPHLVIVGGVDPRIFSGTALPDMTGLVRAGRVTDPELHALYRRAVGLCTPSIYEGFGLPSLEAMALGCPVLAARAGALPEVLGAAAMYLDPFDAAAWTHGMGQLLSEPSLRAELRTQGLAQASKYTWERAARQLLAHLDRLGCVDAEGAGPH